MRLKMRRKHKYHAKRIVRQGISWPSTGEYRRYCQLQSMERGGAITELERQPLFYLTKARISYRADYSYTEEGRRIIEDFKGVQTPRFKLICRLWKHYGPHLLRITGSKRGRFVVTDEIEPEDGEKK